MRFRRQRGVEQARARAKELYPTHPGLRTAYVKGWLARQRGSALTACPYRRSVGWSFVWRDAWSRGWRLG